MTTSPTRRPAHRALPALALLLGAALASLVLTAAPASAHASLVSSDPADGATVDRTPDDVTLTFSEDVREPAFVAVTTADGTDVTDGRVAVDGPAVTRAIDTATAGGEVTVAYRVVSADGHPIEGELTFTAPAVAEPTDEPSEDAPDGAASQTSPEPSPETAPSTADTEPAARQTAGDDSFWSQYGVVLLVALVVAAAVAALLAASRRRSRS